MKRVIIALMVLGLMFSLAIGYASADSTRTIATKTHTTTASEVVSTQGVVIYKISGYANAASSLYGLYNATTLGTATASVCKFEGGEGTQYDSIPYVDFGEDGLVFNTGLTIVVSGAYVTIEYR